MKKEILFVLICLFFMPYVLAINVAVEKVSANDVIINGVDDPAFFELKIKNIGASDNFQFYNFLGFSMAPKGTVAIASGETKNVQLIVYPREDLKVNGFYTFQYFIRSQNGDESTQELTIKMVDLKDAFEVGSGEVNPESNSIEIYIHNKENFNFEQVNARFSSAFFDFEETFSLNSLERKNFEVQLDKENFKKLMAGFYTLNVDVKVENEEADVEGMIKFVEKDILTTTKEDYGFLINTQVIEKTNEGNLIAETETVIKKNILSRLFTTLSPEPSSVDRHGLSVYYTWSNKINPGEKFSVTVRTNWLFPLLVIFFIVVIVALARQYSSTNVILSKRVSFVKSKGGEFALKVSIVLKAKNSVERVNVIDRLPNLVKVYERFGGEHPKRVNESARRIEWEFENLQQGESRVLSYIIYSKIGVIGKFALPSATAIYEKDGKIQEAYSNRAFFMTEQRKKEIEE
ncbi:hypothetical protein J4407_03340 [Candidatus Pacearchaeota archaeon]|nr:hypothetical protein [Candidatus Pacearchaeota archaeon]